MTRKRWRYIPKKMELKLTKTEIIMDDAAWGKITVKRAKKIDKLLCLLLLQRYSVNVGILAS